MSMYTGFLYKVRGGHAILCKCGGLTPIPDKAAKEYTEEHKVPYQEAVYQLTLKWHICEEEVSR